MRSQAAARRLRSRAPTRTVTGTSQVQADLPRQMMRPAAGVVSVRDGAVIKFVSFDALDALALALSGRLCSGRIWMRIRPETRHSWRLLAGRSARPTLTRPAARP